MLHEERVIVKRLIEQTKKNQIQWRLPMGPIGGFEYFAGGAAIHFSVEWLQNNKPTLFVFESGFPTILIRDYSVSALIHAVRRQLRVPPTKNVIPGKTKLDKILIQIKREALQYALGSL